MRGKSDSIVIERNNVNLDTSVWEDTTDKYVALRVRQYNRLLDNNTMIFVNNFLQGVQTMMANFSQLKRCPHVRKNKWEEAGQSPEGCPFGLKKD